MIRYLVIHNKHEGCYDFQCYQDEAARIRLTSITINPPKIFMFSTRDEAQDFFEEYINDVDCLDIRCKRGDDVEHIDYCTCGVIELDDKGEPVLFYNKKNQIFLMEHGPQMFLPNQELKNDIRNLNLTNRLIRKCKSLGREQRKRYIELGKYCEECNAETLSDSEDESNKKSDENIVLKENAEPVSVPATVVVQPPVSPEKKKKVTKKGSATPATATPATATEATHNTEAKEATNTKEEPEKKKRAPRKPKNTDEDKK